MRVVARHVMPTWVRITVLLFAVLMGGMAMWLWRLVDRVGDEAVVLTFIAAATAVELLVNAVRGSWRFVLFGLVGRLVELLREGWTRVAEPGTLPPEEARALEASGRQLRQDAISLLELLADPDAQREYRGEVTTADVPTELVCMWFDDLYHPRSRAFQAAFTEDEAGWLADFHQAFHERLGALGYAGEDSGASPGTVEELHANPVWSEVVDEARRTLHRFTTPEPSAHPG